MEPQWEKNQWELAIDKLKEAVKDLAGENPNLNDDLYLLRFLKAKQFKLKKAEKMVRKTIKWRKEMNCDELIKQEFHPGISKLLHIHKGTLKDGTRFALVNAGGIDYHKEISRFTVDTCFEFVLHQALVEEKFNIDWNKAQHSASGSDEITPESIKGQYFFLDFKGVGIEQISYPSSLSLAFKLAKSYKKYFPVLGAGAIVINVPKWVLPLANTLLKMVESPYLDIKLYHENEAKYKEAVLKLVDADQVSPNFGGTLTSVPVPA